VSMQLVKRAEFERVIVDTTVQEKVEGQLASRNGRSWPSSDAPPSHLIAHCAHIADRQRADSTLTRRAFPLAGEPSAAFDPPHTIAMSHPAASRPT
jgi:hypothetical protein